MVRAREYSEQPRPHSFNIGVASAKSASGVFGGAVPRRVKCGTPRLSKITAFSSSGRASNVRNSKLNLISIVRLPRIRVCASIYVCALYPDRTNISEQINDRADDSAPFVKFPADDYIPARISERTIISKLFICARSSARFKFAAGLVVALSGFLVFFLGQNLLFQFFSLFLGKHLIQFYCFEKNDNSQPNSWGW